MSATGLCTCLLSSAAKAAPTACTGGNRCGLLAALSGDRRQSTLSTVLRSSGVLLQVILWELMTNKEPWGDMTPMQVSLHFGKANTLSAVAVPACTLQNHRVLHAAGCVYGRAM